FVFASRSSDFTVRERRLSERYAVSSRELPRKSCACVARAAYRLRIRRVQGESGQGRPFPQRALCRFTYGIRLPCTQTKAACLAATHASELSICCRERGANVRPRSATCGPGCRRGGKPVGVRGGPVRVPADHGWCD